MRTEIVDGHIVTFTAAGEFFSSAPIHDGGLQPDAAVALAAEALAVASTELDARLGSSVTTIAGIRAATKDAIAAATEIVSNPISRQVLAAAATAIEERFTSDVNSVPEIKAALVDAFTAAAQSLGAPA